LKERSDVTNGLVDKFAFGVLLQENMTNTNSSITTKELAR